MRQRRSIQMGIGVAVILALMLVGVAVAAVQIDTFDSGNNAGDAAVFVCFGGSLCSGLGNPDTNSTIVSAVLGGERDMYIVRNTGGGEVKLIIDEGDNNRAAFTQADSTSGVATITWDGSDGLGATLDPDGLCVGDPNCTNGLGVDLTENGANDGIHFEVPFDDNPVDVEFRIYSGSDTEYSYYLLNLPGGIPSGTHVDFFMPFDDFQDVGATGASLDNVGAIQVIIDGTPAEGADMSLDFLDADDFRDYGDLPLSYGDASHIANGLRLGANVDIEAAPPVSPGSLADQDDLTEADDEDGVSPTQAGNNVPFFNWVVGTNGGWLDVTVNGCSGTCYLNGWIDWNNNGSFDTGEQILQDRPITNGTYADFSAQRFDIPGGVTFDTTYYARFRICNTTGTCDGANSANVPGGEVEDFLWSFGPNAIELQSLDARSNPSNMTAIVVAALVIMLAAGLFLKFAAQSRRA